MSDLPGVDDVTEAESDVDGGLAALPLGRTAELVGEYRWIETTLFTLLGTWVLDVPIAAVQVHLDAQSMRHAWHAELWGDRLPVLAGVDPDGLTRPSPATAALLRRPRRGRPGGGGAGVDVAGRRGRGHGPPRRTPPAGRTVPGRPPAPGDDLHAAPAGGGPGGRRPADRRALRLVLRDEVEDWLAGERLVQRLVTRPHDVAAVHGFQQHLESVAVAAGAHSGLVDLPEGVPLD